MLGKYKIAQEELGCAEYQVGVEKDDDGCRCRYGEDLSELL